MAQILPNTKGKADRLNRSMPAASAVKLGNLLNELIATVNAQRDVITTLVTKLNADAGVTDTNYTAASLKAVKTLDQR